MQLKIIEEFILKNNQQPSKQPSNQARASLSISRTIDLLTSLWGRFCWYHHNHPQFADKETEAQRKKDWVTQFVVV